MRLSQRHTHTSPGAAWLAAFLIGTVLGLGLRLFSFLAGALLLQGIGTGLARLPQLLTVLDPVYTRAAEQTLGVVQIQGLAVIGPLGDQLHAWLPTIFVPAARAHWSLVRLVVQPGSPVLGRLLAAGFAHAAVLTAGLLLVRHG